MRIALIAITAAALLSWFALVHAAGKPKKQPGIAPIVEGKAGKQAEEVVLALDKEFTGTAFVSVGDKIILYKSYGLADAA